MSFNKCSSRWLYKTILLLLLGVMLFQPMISRADEPTKTLTPVELQSRLMSFADDFVAQVSGATLDFVQQGHAQTPMSRAAVQGRKLHACTSAISIAAGRNPEVALLDMLVLVRLLKYSTADYWIPNILGPAGNMFLPVYDELENDIWIIARQVLNKTQQQELTQLIDNWHDANRGKLNAIADVRFAEFGDKRHDSSLFDQGKPKGLLAKVDNATQEVQRTRLFAERALFLAERQPTLIRWQMQQVFYELAMTDELQQSLKNTRDIATTSDKVANSLDKVSRAIDGVTQIVNANSKATLREIVDQLSSASGQAANQFINGLLIKIFMLAVSVILVALFAVLSYKFLALKMQQALIKNQN